MYRSCAECPHLDNSISCPGIKRCLVDDRIAVVDETKVAEGCPEAWAQMVDVVLAEGRRERV